MRAWLEILRERHPDLSWIAVEGTDPLEEQMESIEAKTTV
jgi:hypothetical protein